MVQICIKAYLSISLLLFLHPAKAQFGTGSPEKIKTLYDRPLIVIVEIESPKIVAQLTKMKRPDKIERYRKAIADYNTNMKQAVEKFWRFNPNIIYKTHGEVDKIFRSKSTYYSVLYCATFENFKTQGDSGGRLLPGLNWYCMYKNPDLVPDYWDNYTVMQVKLIEDYTKPATVFYQNLTDIIPEKADLVFGLHVMQYYAQEKGVNKMAKTADLKDVIAIAESNFGSKTLLLKDTWVRNLPSSEIKANYPYRFEVLSASDLNDRVFQADSATAFVHIIPEVNSAKNKIKISYIHLIVDAASGNVLAISMPGLAEKGNKVITKDNIKDYMHSAKRPSRVSVR